MADTVEAMESQDSESVPAPASSAESPGKNEIETQAPVNEITPGADAVDITPDKDSGVLKEIIRKGAVDESPSNGDTVFVHYVGTLTDGSQFDSSRDRGEQFSFTLGKGQVIKAWDLGVAAMKRGELARLHCTGPYAYGEQGSPPKIPPNATLVFEVELFDWKGEDLTSEKDGCILRSTLEEGEGYLKPSDGGSCQIHVKGSFNGSIFEDRDVSFIVGEGCEAGVVEGVELAIEKFKKSERSRLRIASKYAYGEAGNKDFNIPPNADLDYEVTLSTFEKTKEAWEMEDDEKLEQSEVMKNKGTGFFKQAKYQLAVKYYKKIPEFLDDAKSLEGEKAEKKEALINAAHLNLAMCHLKLLDYRSAIEECNKALEKNPTSEKGLFRRATAHLSLQELDEAQHDFKAVLDVDPANKAAKNQLTIISQRIQAAKQKEKRTYAGMFDRFAEIDTKKEEMQPKPKVDKSAEGEMQNESGSDSKEGDSESGSEAMEASETTS